jgi:hypothetical protein
VSATLKEIYNIDTSIEPEMDSWSSLPDGFRLQLGLARRTSSVVGNGTTTTVTTTAAHGFSASSSVIIAGVTPSGFNGTYTIASTPTTTTFTYANATNATATVQGTAELSADRVLLLDDLGNELLIQ